MENEQNEEFPIKKLLKEATDVMETLVKNKGISQIQGKEYSIFNVSHMIALKGKTLKEAAANMQKTIDPTKTGVLYIEVPEIFNFKDMPAFPQVFRLNLDHCIIHSFEGIRVAEDVAVFELRESIIYSYKGLSLPQLLSIILEAWYQSDQLWKNLPHDQQLIMQRGIECFKKIAKHNHWSELGERGQYAMKFNKCPALQELKKLLS